jgi:hypothetical protein
MKNLSISTVPLTLFPESSRTTRFLRLKIIGEFEEKEY